MGGEELEEAADAEVAKVLEEMNIGLFDDATVGSKTLPNTAVANQSEAFDTSEEDALRERLEAM